MPVALQHGIAVLGMKPYNGTGAPFHSADVKLQPEDAMRYAMSVPGVTTTITGCESLAVLRQNLQFARNFTPMSATEMEAVRTAVAPLSGDGRFELYKVSLANDNIVTRAPHQMPIAARIHNGSRTRRCPFPNDS